VIQSHLQSAAVPADSVNCCRATNICAWKKDFTECKRSLRKNNFYMVSYCLILVLFAVSSGPLR